MSCDFLTLFGQIPDEAITRLPADTQVEQVQIEQESRTMRLSLSFPHLVRGADVDAVAAALRDALNLTAVETEVKMPPESFSEAYFGTLVAEVNRSIAATNGFFKDATCTLHGNDLIVVLQHGGAEVLKSCECDREIERIVMRRFSRPVTVYFEGRDPEVTDDAVVSMIRTAEDDNFRAKGFDPQEVLVKMSLLEPVAGRFQTLRSPRGYTAIVDYAHTPDALVNVLDTIREVVGTNGHIITVCGCGGDRDAGKRPIMAREAAVRSDRVVLTSDNSRSEDPDEILRQMEVGVPEEARPNVLTITDRRQGIRTACQLAQQGDVVLIAGKGHEDYQEIKGVKHHFDDREQVLEVFDGESK